MALGAYRPALLLQRDAYYYIQHALSFDIAGIRPPVYPLFIKPLLATGALWTVPAAQHVLGLLCGAACYVLLLRLGLPPVWSALGAAPVLLDGFQIEMEQYVLSETLFEALSLAALAVLLWANRVSPGRAAVAGLLLALAIATRFVGLGLLAPMVLYALARPVGSRRLAAGASLLCAALVPLAAYGAASLGSSESRSPAAKLGYPLYGRVAPLADCDRLRLPRPERPLCLDRLPKDGSRPFTIWSPLSPARHLHAPRGTTKDALIRDFTLRVIAQEPGAYAGAVADDLARYFSPNAPRLDPHVRFWRFPRSLSDARPLNEFVEKAGAAPLPRWGLGDGFSIAAGPASFLRDYQRHVFMWGPLLGALLIAGLAGAALPARSNGLRAAAALMVACVLGLLLFRLAFGVYGYRYVIVTLPFAGPAGAAGLALVSARLGRLAPSTRIA
jgi:hypothetical protein